MKIKPEEIFIPCHHQVMEGLYEGMANLNRFIGKLYIQHMSILEDEDESTELLREDLVKAQRMLSDVIELCEFKPS